MATGEEPIDLADDVGLGRLDGPPDTKAAALTIAVGGGPVVNRLASIPEGDAAGAESMEGLSLEATVGLPPQLPDVLGVHRPVNANRNSAFSRPEWSP